MYADALFFLHTLGRISLKAAVLVLLILAVQALFHRRLDPRWRCALWLIVVVRLLLPFSWSTQISVFNWLPRFGSPPPEIAAEAIPSGAVFAAAEAMPASPATVPVTASLWWIYAWPEFLFALWAAGAALLGGRLIRASLRYQRRLRSEPAVTDPAVLALMAECQRKMGIPGRLRIVETKAVATPALYGLIRPRLLLPQRFAGQLSVQELRFVLLHELAHLRRRDLPLNWLMVGLQIVHWFNPLVWLGFSRWRADRELACDALALEAAGAGQIKPYGETLLRLLQGMAAPAAAPGIVGISEDPRQLRRRIGMIARFRPRPSWSALGIVLVAGLAVGGLTDAKSQVGALASTAAPGSAVGAAAAPAPRFIYRIGAGDRIHVALFREPTLAADAVVDGKGNVSLALVGDIHLAGLTVSEARKKVEDAYRATGKLNEPVGVSLSMVDYEPQEVAITGQIKNPARYLLPPEGTLSVVELVTKAGGFTDIAKGQDVIISHRGGSSGKKTITHVDVAAILHGEGQLSPDDPSLVLHDGDLVYVPEILAPVQTPQEVAITGQIKNPGRYLLPSGGTLSVVELLTKAGGFTDIAKRQDIRITRRGGPSGKNTIIHVDVRAILRGEGQLRPDDPSLVLHDGDLVYVPEAKI